MVGQLTLDQHIGVRIPGGQPIFSAPSDVFRSGSPSWLVCQQALPCGVHLDADCAKSANRKSPGWGIARAGASYSIRVFLGTNNAIRICVMQSGSNSPSLRELERQTQSVVVS